MRRIMLCAALPALGVLAATARAAPDDEEKKELEDLRRDMAEMKKAYERRISDLEKRVADEGAGAPELMKAVDDLTDRVDSMDSRINVLKASTGGGRAAYLDISFNSLMTAGTSTADESTLQALEGGHHDPHKRGFTIQNTEIGLSGAVDPYFKGFANMVQTIDQDGETVVELEEAYAKTTSLPYGLQVKAGQYFTDFGRLNPQHPHQWEFVDQPVVNGRMFGDDGMRGPGAQVSWLVPRAPVEIVTGVQNANGNTMRSFAGPAEDGPVIGTQHDRAVRTFADTLWSQRANVSFDLTDEMPAMIGVSNALGPSAASGGGSADILGADVTVKWKPLANDHGFPYVAFQGEWMRRHLGYDSFVDGTTFVPGGELRDSGEYAQLVYGFHRDWTLGVRFDRVGETADGEDVATAARNRWSTALTFYTSEFAKIRLQINFDDSDALGRREQSVWIQFEFNLGVHGAHKF